MKNDSIETYRLILRPFCKEDFYYLKKLLKDPEVMHFSINGPYRDDNEIKKFLNESIKSQKKYGFGAVAILLKKTNQWLGFCKLFREKDKITDFGYRLFKEYWNQGYATEAVKACCDYIKKNFPDEKIYCYIEPDNKGSIRVAEKSAMTNLGKGHLPWVNCFKYRI